MALENINNNQDPQSWINSTTGDIKKVIVYHASRQVVKTPRWNYVPPGRSVGEQEKKDFGIGFYTCIHPDYPIELYCAYDTVIVNKYELDLSGLDPKPIRFENDRTWLLVVAAHRDNFSRFRKWHDLRDQIRETVKTQHVMIGAISNDRFFSAFERFLAGGYTDEFTIRVAQLINYPEQYVLKSDVACQRIEFAGYGEVAQDVLVRHRDRKADSKALERQRIRDLEEAARADGTFGRGMSFQDIVEEVYDNGGFRL